MDSKDAKQGHKRADGESEEKKWAAEDRQPVDDSALYDALVGDDMPCPSYL